MPSKFLILLLLIVTAVVCAFGRNFAEEKPAVNIPAEDAKPKKLLFRGVVVPIPRALKTLGVKAYPEELKDQVALLTPENELLPILPDWRGRAFFQDERLRDRKVELIGYRKPGLPYLQVLTIFTFDAGFEAGYGSASRLYDVLHKKPGDAPPGAG